MSSRSRQRDDAFHLGSLFTVSNLDQMQEVVCVTLLSPARQIAALAFVGDRRPYIGHLGLTVNNRSQNDWVHFQEE
jgi:hypothetical protein